VAAITIQPLGALDDLLECGMSAWILSGNSAVIFRVSVCIALLIPSPSQGTAITIQLWALWIIFQVRDITTISKLLGALDHLVSAGRQHIP
jgi:hypothetical protein